MEHSRRKGRPLLVAAACAALTTNVACQGKGDAPPQQPESSIGDATVVEVQATDASAMINVAPAASSAATVADAGAATEATPARDAGARDDAGAVRVDAGALPIPRRKFGPPVGNLRPPDFKR